MSLRWEDLREIAIEHALPVAARLALVLALFLFGRAIARAVVRTLDRVLAHRNAETSLRKFIGDVAYAAMLAALGVVLLDTLGVKTTAVVAVLGAAGLAVGLALQGSLSNFAAGVMLILLRPYRVGELVALGPHRGRVDAIRIFHTIVIAADHRQITIPNGQILAHPIENLTTLGRRRIDVTVSVGGAPDLEAVRRAIIEIAAADPRIEPEPAPWTELAEVSEAGARLVVRVWAASDAIGEVGPALLERLQAGLSPLAPRFTIALGPA